ncbi:MAG TPA: glycosyltransferase [Frankiaceae bacterium]|jgi:UDP:flavonoid glycosyltransferase YjiC (YdhE family)|nr:glycosyltransferase [Frankiaceae bacterium]
MSRVLVTSTPGTGHVLPLLRLARALRDRGDDVRWAVGPRGIDLVRREGFEAVEAGPGEPERHEEYLLRHPDVPPPGPARRVHAFANMFGGVAAPAFLRAVLPFAEEWRPEVVVHDVGEMAAPVVAARLGVPCVAQAFGIPAPLPAVAAAGAVLEPLWREHGLEPRPYGTDDLYLDVCPPPLHNGQTPPAAGVRQVRPAEGAPRVAGGRPLVYVTFGTAFNKQPGPLREVVLAAAASGADVLVTVGTDGDPASLGDLPGNVAAERFVPQAEVLPRCAAVVSHAGSGTLFGALAHGLPNVLLPQGADQFTNAERTAACGAGVAFGPGEPVRDDVAAAVARVLEEPSYAEAAARVAEAIAAMPGPEAAAEAVAALVT